jgi:hypothetical protein
VTDLVFNSVAERKNNRKKPEPNQIRNRFSSVGNGSASPQFLLFYFNETAFTLYEIIKKTMLKTAMFFVDQGRKMLFKKSDKKRISWSLYPENQFDLKVFFLLHLPALASLFL